jgi:hypothetical protein
MAGSNPLVPIYSSKGDVGAFLYYPYILDREGEWIGWVNQDRQVFSVRGNHIGWLTHEPRILRKVSGDYMSRQTPPEIPPHISLPPTIPLAPLLAELTFGTIDVLDDAPELLPALDFGEMHEDMD